MLLVMEGSRESTHQGLSVTLSGAREVNVQCLVLVPGLVGFYGLSAIALTLPCWQVNQPCPVCCTSCPIQAGPGETVALGFTELLFHRLFRAFFICVLALSYQEPVYSLEPHFFFVR